MLLDIYKCRQLLYASVWSRKVPTQPNPTQPNRTEPNRTGPNRTEPNRTETNRTEPSRAEPSRTDKNWRVLLSRAKFNNKGDVMRGGGPALCTFVHTRPASPCPQSCPALPNRPWASSNPCEPLVCLFEHRVPQRHRHK